MARILVERFQHPVTGTLEFKTKLGVLGSIRGERDRRIPDDMMPAQPDPAQPGFGYTGRLLDVSQVILVANETVEQVEAWQRAKGTPWPFSGVATSITRKHGMTTMTVAAANGTWRWVLHPALFPQMRDHRLGELGWSIGVLS